MKMLTLVGLVALSLLTSCKSSEADSRATRPEQVDMQKSMEEYMMLGMPGEEHAELARQVGTWKTTTSHREGPDGPWQSMVGTATYEPLFGGRFVIARDKGSFEMEGQQMEHESLLILGFDRLHQEWTSRYYSSMSTWSGGLHGKKNAKGEIVFEGTHYDNITPDGRPVKAISRWEGNDKMVFDMWDSIGGEMVHIMNWTAERMN